MSVYTLYLLEGALVAVSPADGSELRLEAPTIWTSRAQLPWAFKAEAGALFTVALQA